MTTLECSISGLSRIDASDVDALMRMNEVCLNMLLDPALWAWAIGFTLVCIGVGALIGWSKGRMTSGIIWAAVLGPIGWIIVALGKSNLDACPECSRNNRPWARICRHCGVELAHAKARSARSRMRASEGGSRKA